MFTIKEEWQKVALAGLLHDIGKLIHRCDTYSNLIPQLGRQHQALSVWFFNELVDRKIIENDELIRTMIQRHHEDPRISKEFNVNELSDSLEKQLALLVSRADNYSSKERLDEGYDDNYKTTTYKTTPLESIFNQINLEQEKVRELKRSNFKLSQFNKESIFPSEHKENTQRELEKQVEDFMEEIYKLKVNNFDSLFNQLLIIFEKYTWCIPSDTQTKTNDIPLFDHLKTTSAIALASYRYNFSFERVTQDRIKKGKDEKHFAIIGGDISGIQKYIYNLGSQKNGVKRLRARSFYIKTLMDLVAYRIIKELNLTPANIIMQAGGKFSILASNLPETYNIVEKIEKVLTDELYEKFKGDIFIALDIVELSGNELSESYDKTNNTLNYLLDKKKKKKFSDKIIENPIFHSDDYSNGQGAKLCPICQKNIFIKNEACTSCIEEILIGQKLPNTDYLAVLEGEKGDFNFLDLGVRLCKGKEVNKYIDKSYLIVNLKDFSLVENAHMLRGTYGGYIPRNNEGETLSFEEIAQGAKGVKNLGILKADVDSLGDIFSRGFKEKARSISRIANLSKLLDSFFSSYIEETIRLKRSLEYKNIKIDLTNFYLVYAGGDDLMIVAPWNELIWFSKYLVDEFTKFTNNEYFTISCGLHLMRLGDPFFMASEEATELEELAKISGKNGLAIWDRYIPWADFDKVFLENGEKYVEYKKANYFSQSFLYRLLKYTSMAEKYIKNKDIWQLSFVSKFVYDMERNLAEKIAKKHNITKDKLDLIPQWNLPNNTFYILDKDKNIDKNKLKFIKDYMRVVLNYAVRLEREVK
jgi:CRISPR-associated protein Csm1